jgi:archaellum component FlaC
LNNSADPNLRQEIGDTIGRRQDQLDNLNKLFHTMERADLQLENTLTSLGTVYSQVLLIDAGDVNSSKTQRLRESISEQVNGLQDLLSSMDEVYGNSQDQLTRASQNMARK